MTAKYPFSVDGNEFQGQRVLVTGGTKGMGEAIVRRLTMGGGSVATTARSPLPKGQQPALLVQRDIGMADGVQAVVDRLLKHWGGVDILVNDFGGSDAPNGGFQAHTDDDWQRALNVNLMAAVRFDRSFLPGMLERRSGVILHIASIQASSAALRLDAGVRRSKSSAQHLQQRPCERSGSEGRAGQSDLARFH